jgi:hypothetical protein
MMKHPGKTPAQRRVLDEIGCGNNSPMMSDKTREKLLKDGLIVELSPKVFQDRFGKLTIRQFEMPIHVHMEWCLSVSEEVEGGENAET